MKAVIFYILVTLLNGYVAAAMILPNQEQSAALEAPTPVAACGIAIADMSKELPE